MYLSIDAAKRYIFYSSIKFQKLTIQLFYQTYDPLIHFELSIIILIYHMQYNICISMQGILILIFQKSGIKVSRNNCFIFCSKKRDESTIEEDRTIYIYRTVRPVKINWYVSRCSESFLENAPDARWGVALADRHCLESPSFIRPTCRMLDAYQFMPHLRIPRVGGEPLSLFLSLLPFRTPGAWLTSGEAFPFDITYVLTIPGVTSPRRK